MRPAGGDASHDLGSGSLTARSADARCDACIIRPPDWIRALQASSLFLGYSLPLPLRWSQPLGRRSPTAVGTLLPRFFRCRTWWCPNNHKPAHIPAS
ncbi:hypothetical protein ISCGN_005467 [Ixodes scapularis]